MDDNDLTITDMILINIIERENKRKYINVSNEIDQMEGHRIQSYFQSRMEAMLQILRYLEMGVVQYIDNVVLISISAKPSDVESIMKEEDDIKEGDLVEESIARHHKRAAPVI